MTTAMLIRELREFQGISQQKLAQQTGISQSAIARWELGQVEPTVIGLKKLADFFDISVDELLCRTSHQGIFNEKRQDKYSEILELYESLTPELQAHALAYLHGLADRSAVQNSATVKIELDDRLRKRQ